MSPLDTGFPRDPGQKKRMLPSVTDVVRELAKTISADPAVLFKAARSVVAEELAKVKQGFEAAPLDVLMRRARLQLERDGEGVPVSEPPPPTMPVFPARPASPREPPGSPAPSAKPAATDDPFQDLASRSDLNWEKELPIQPEDAPFRSAILPIPHRSRGPAGISAPAEPVRDRGSAPAPLTFAPDASGGQQQTPRAAQAPPPGAPSPVTYPPEPRVPERKVFEPKVFEPRAFEPKVSEPMAPEPKSPERVEPPRDTRPGLTGDLFDAPPVTAPRLRRPTVASAPSIPLVHPSEPASSGAPTDPLPAPAGAGFERFLKMPPPPPPREKRESHDPAARSMSEMPPLNELVEDNTQPAMEEFHFKAPDPPATPPTRSARRSWLVAIALVLAVGAGLAWAVREYVFKNEIVKPVAPIARKKPDEVPVPTAAPLQIPTPAPVVGAKSKPGTSSVKPGPAVQKGKAALLLTPDWAGKPAIFVIHFSSTKDRESAAKDAVRLAAALGAPARAVEVDLGDKGVWYRVVVGEFPDVDAARAFRAGLEAKKTPGMGFVYEMRGR